MNKSTSIVILSTFLCLISSLPAYSNQNTPFDAEGYSLPFVNTPKGVQDYANSIDWGSRKKVNFFDIGTGRYGCRMILWRMVTTVLCDGGYVEVSDPVNSRVCELKNVRYIPYFREMEYKTERCSIK